MSILFLFVGFIEYSSAKLNVYLLRKFFIRLKSLRKQIEVKSHQSRADAWWPINGIWKEMHFYAFD